MKRKGKSGMGKGMGPPSAMVEQQRQYAEYQKQREASGLPSFDLYVKGPNSPTWYPAGSLGGDKKAKDALKFGYKVSYPGLLEKRPEAKEVTELSEDMQDNAFEKMKKNMGF